MCRGTAYVAVEAQDALADLMRDIAAAICPEDPGSVVIGPVDFGASREGGATSGCPALPKPASSAIAEPTTAVSHGKVS